jgi:hypothetical protein
VRQSPLSYFPRDDQDQRAVEEVQLTLGALFAGTAFLRGMKFLARITS